ncbi:MAG: hypothetical protein GYA20_12415, partial [Chloroflexi bacterium]|nr:hypothetical protein [Chloroflexota bacterium]
TLAAADHALRVEFIDAAPAAPLETRSAADRQLGQVIYTDLWPGIDLAYEQVSGNAKSTYTLAPGADPAAIRLRYNRPAEILPDGSLAFDFEGGRLTESAPLAWQETPAGLRAVDARFELRPDGSLGLALGAYDPALPLVIDPDYQWHTFYGGYVATETAGALYRADGNLLVVGTRYDPRYDDKDIFAVLFDPNGNWLDEGTYGGLDYDDIATGVTERDNHAYIVGYSYGSFYQSGDPVNPFSGYTDILVIYIDPNLSIGWFTFLGSFDYDFGRGIAVTSTWDVLVTGESYSSWTVNSTAALHAYNGGSDLVAASLDDYGEYQWHTFYGSQGDEYAGGASLELDTYFWLSGSSPAGWTGPGGTQPVRAHSGGYDMTALVLDTNGSYVLHGFYGSSGADYGKSIAVDSQGLAYLTGYSDATWGTPKHAHSGGYDLTVVKLNDNGDFYWNTFYGSAGDDFGYSAQIDPMSATSSVYLAGTSAQGWNGPDGQAPANAYAGGTDMFALVLTSAGNYSLHTFYGSPEAESGASLAFSSAALALVGASLGSWAGPAGQEPVAPFHGVNTTTAVGLQPNLTYDWHTFLEFDWTSPVSDSGEMIEVLEDGSILVAGYSTYGFRGPRGQAPLHKNSDPAGDLFLLKMDPSGEYLWHTFYGANGEFDIARDVAVDSFDNIYLVGSSAGSWNGPAGQLPKHAFSGIEGNFVILKLNDNGEYMAHTFYGPVTGGASGNEIVVDGSSYLYVVATSTNTWNGPAGQPPLHALTGRDITVLKLNLKLEYQWHTFYGCTDLNDGFALGLSGTTLVIAGDSDHGWNGPAGQRPIRAHTGSLNEGVLIKLNLDGAYVWHTFHGNNSLFSNVYIDADQNIYAGGYSFELWLGPAGQHPTHKPATREFGNAAHLLKLNAAGAYQWHAFFVGAEGANFHGIDGGPDGTLYVTGTSDDAWYGNGSIPPAHAFSGASRDLTVVAVSDAGSYQWHTFYPASEGWGVAYDAAAQRVLVAGKANSSWHGDAGQPPLHAYADGQDVLILSLLDTGPTPRTLFLPFVKR